MTGRIYELRRLNTTLTWCECTARGPSERGGQLIDDEYLRSRGATDDDIAKYRYDPNVEPPRLLAGEREGAAGDADAGDWDVRRGVRRRGGERCSNDTLFYFLLR